MKKLTMLFAALLAFAGLALAAVNVNTATKAELESLDGVGPVKAQAIIDYRTKNGNFKSLEDLKKVDGIGDATFDKVKKDVSLTGKTSIAQKDEKKADEKKAEPKKDEKKAEPKKDEKKADAKKDDKKADAKKDDKKSDAKKDEKKDEKKDDEKKADEKKSEEKKK